MIRPGVNVTVRTASAPSGPSTDTGQWFVVGTAERGPTDRPVLLRNMTDFDTYFGNRVAWSELYDSLDAFFHEGGVRATVQRVAGPAASAGSLTLDDRAGTPLDTLTVAAASPGAWSTDLKVEVKDGAADDTFELFVTYKDVLQERSGDLASPTDAVLWGLTSNWVRVADESSATAAPTNNPKVLVATALSAGADDRASITDSHRIAALDLFTVALGPGQVSVPGATTDAIHEALVDHATLCNRTALLDAVDDGDVDTLVAAAEDVQAECIEPERGALVAPRIIIPGLATSTVRSVPASAIVAGLMARNDAVNGTGVPAAGARGQSRYALDVTFQFTDEDREAANDAGICVLKPLFGPITLYGYRTLSPELVWRSLSDQRLRMEIVNAADIIGENFLFDQLDGQGHTIAAFGGALTGMLAQFYNRGDLYGATPDDAFFVNVDSAVNTPTTIANGELHAVLGLHMSPFAEMIQIEIVKSPINQPL